MLKTYENKLKVLHLQKKWKVAVLGSGSWATALVKILTENKRKVSWYVRNNESSIKIKKHGINPKYLNSLKLKTKRLNIGCDINKIVEEVNVIIVAIPSVYAFKELNKINIDVSEKIFISAVKGVLPEKMQILGNFFHDHFKISYNQIGVISGPCHAEEIAMEKLSYLTFSCPNSTNAKVISKWLRCKYVRVSISGDITGTEYAAMLKNCYAIAAGAAHGLGYGDNFMSVLMSSSIREMKKFIKNIYKMKRNINNSAYLGDLLVTGYSSFSRNRKLGVMLGKGYDVKDALLEMDMIAEGYYGSKSAFQINKKFKSNTPILDTVYTIMYEKTNAKKAFKKLESKLD
jgi:glycerol-3-phosphate dehydrogenase (NAD(P)+)